MSTPIPNQTSNMDNPPNTTEIHTTPDTNTLIRNPSNTTDSSSTSATVQQLSKPPTLQRATHTPLHNTQQNSEIPAHSHNITTEQIVSTDINVSAPTLLQCNLSSNTEPLYTFPYKPHPQSSSTQFSGSMIQPIPTQPNILTAPHSIPIAPHASTQPQPQNVLPTAPTQHRNISGVIGATPTHSYVQSPLQPSLAQCQINNAFTAQVPFHPQPAHITSNTPVQYHQPAPNAPLHTPAVNTIDQNQQPPQQLQLQPQRIYTLPTPLVLPRYTPSQPHAWFATADCMFMAAQMTDDRTKFAYVLSYLDDDTRLFIQQLQEANGSLGSYEAMKNALLEKQSKQNRKQFHRQVVNANKYQNMPPTRILRQLQEDLQGIKLSEEHRKDIFLSVLPKNIQTALISNASQSTLYQIADMADKMYDIPGETPHTTVPMTSNNNATNSTLNQLLTTVQDLKTKFDTLQAKTEKSHTSSTNINAINEQTNPYTTQTSHTYQRQWQPSHRYPLWEPRQPSTQHRPYYTPQYRPPPQRYSNPQSGYLRFSQHYKNKRYIPYHYNNTRVEPYHPHNRPRRFPPISNNGSSLKAIERAPQDVSSRTQPNTKEHNSQQLYSVCHYHIQYGETARNCVGACFFKDKTSGN